MHRNKSALALATSGVFVGVSSISGSVVPYNANPGQYGSSVTTVLIPSSGANPAIQAGALTDDPQLANYCTYDFQVVVSSASGQDRWAAADLRFVLGFGQFYIPPSVGGVPTDSNYLQPPDVRNLAGQRFLQADSMVMSPIGSSSRGGVLGKSTFAPATQAGEIFPSNGSNFLDPNDPNGTAFLPANSMQMIDVAWGDSTAALQPAGSNGTFTIARFTVKAGSTGSFIGRLGSTLAPSRPVSFTYIFDPGGLCPEPGSAIMLSAGIGAICLRRRTRSL